jgi:TonB family protein
MTTSSDRERWIEAELAAARRRWLLTAGAAAALALTAYGVVRIGGPLAAVSHRPAPAAAAAEAGAETEAGEPGPAARRRVRRAGAGSGARDADSLLAGLAGGPRLPAVVGGAGTAAPAVPAAERPPYLGEVVELGLTAAEPGRSIPARLRNRDEVVRLLHEHYPPQLRRGGFGGTVVLSLLVDEAGAVHEARVARSSGFPELDAAAKRVAAGMRFAPEQRLGRISTTWVEFPLVFRP